MLDVERFVCLNWDLIIFNIFFFKADLLRQLWAGDIAHQMGQLDYTVNDKADIHFILSVCDHEQRVDEIPFGVTVFPSKYNDFETSKFICLYSDNERHRNIRIQ